MAEYVRERAMYCTQSKKQVAGKADDKAERGSSAVGMAGGSSLKKWRWSKWIEMRFVKLL